MRHSHRLSTHGAIFWGLGWQSVSMLWRCFANDPDGNRYRQQRKHACKPDQRSLPAYGLNGESKDWRHNSDAGH